MNSEPQEDVWMRDGNLIYSLVQDGWRKGVGAYRNRIAVNVVFDRSVPPEQQSAFTEKLYSLMKDFMPYAKGLDQ